MTAAVIKDTFSISYAMSVIRRCDDQNHAHFGIGVGAGYSRRHLAASVLGVGFHAMPSYIWKVNTECVLSRSERERERERDRDSKTVV